MKDDRIGVLFVCLGNICRSPLAEGVFRDLVEEAGLADRFRIDSAGTSGYHDGEGPDPRTVEVARARGVVLDHVSRRVRPIDFEIFEYIIAMDGDNLRKLQRLDLEAQGEAEIALLRSFEEGDGDLHVPDPYFGGPRGFEDVHDMVERACRGLLAHIVDRHDVKRRG
jgi:protein-tyrosine phosphatase